MRALLAASVLALLTACASTPSTGPVGPGEYRVQAGDTLTSIARRNGTTVSQIMRLNNLSNANRISVGEVLKVGGGSTATASSSPSAPARSPSRRAPASAPEAPSGPVGNISLAWPAAGNVSRRFDGSAQKGIDIAGTSGAPVTAAAAGDVAYAGDALRGYGNLIILRHPGNFLTIYAHNRRLLVKEGQKISQGQKIAEVGGRASGAPTLYFEVRAGGVPTDPQRYLPSR